MSGGALTGYTHDLYRLTEWANSVERENPLLAEMLRDMNHLLDRYDYYMSGDIGQDSIRKEWGDFRSKWMLKSESSWNEAVIDRAKAEIDGYLESIRLGYRPEDADGSRLLHRRCEAVRRHAAGTVVARSRRGANHLLRA